MRNAPFLLCGDFNARTANKQPYHVHDSDYFSTIQQEDLYFDHHHHHHESLSQTTKMSVTL